MGIFDREIKATYMTKKKILKLKVNNRQIADFLKIVGGENTTRKSSGEVWVDVSKVKDVETALSMISIVTKIEHK